jgi:oligopeptide/dipeptide ABC transporter ATP-binding protein
MGALLEVKNLRVGRGKKEEFMGILEDVSFEVYEGETLGIVGESGCGKSMTALTIMGLLSKNLSVESGAVYFNGTDLTKLSTTELNQIRGKDISMIFQEPMTSLNPAFTIGNQLAEVFKHHGNYSKKEIREKSIEILTKVRIPDPEEKLKSYPHELSGGMRQRVMIAMALACKPKIVIADEPTTALDVTIQAQILDLLNELQSDLNMAVMFITHDLGVVAETCQRMIVMYAGQVIEEGTVEEVFEHPSHPYTRGLMLSSPRLGSKVKRLKTIEGVVPDLDNMPKGCRFAPRCEFATDICYEQAPLFEKISTSRGVRCWNKL